MFVTKNQIFVFIACIVFGGLSGFLLSAINVFCALIKNRIVKFILSVIAFAIIGVLYSYYSYKMYFPNFRVYMLAGVLLGIYLYYKSFYIILAKFSKKFYNIIKQITTKKKGKGNDRDKSKKNDSGNNRGRGAIANNIAISNGLSNDFN